MPCSKGRAVAQGFSVHVWGTWGRRFKSAQPDTIRGGSMGLRVFFFFFLFFGAKPYPLSSPRGRKRATLAIDAKAKAALHAARGPGAGTVSVFRLWGMLAPSRGARRPSRPEYDERACLASASDGAPHGVEYRLHIDRTCREAGPVLSKEASASLRPPPSPPPEPSAKSGRKGAPLLTSFSASAR